MSEGRCWGVVVADCSRVTVMTTGLDCLPSEVVALASNAYTPASEPTKDGLAVVA